MERSRKLENGEEEDSFSNFDRFNNFESNTRITIIRIIRQKLSFCHQG